MAWLRSTNFDTLLKLGDDWALGRNAASRTWRPLHLHGEHYGWMASPNNGCSACEAVFPDKVIGMWNMMKALD